MNKRPANFSEWVDLWQRLALTLGSHIAFVAQNNLPLMDRETYKLVRQMYRVNLHIKAEQEAMTTDYLSHLYNRIMKGTI